MENFILSFIGILITYSQTISSSGHWNSFRYWCFNAYSDVNLDLGLNTNNFLNRSRQSSDARAKYCPKDLFFYASIELNILMANGDSKDSISVTLGLPSNSIIRSIWLIVELPGNIALPVNSSPIMHPTLHRSTALVYFVDPSSISGALYHLVATYSVNIYASNFF